ncbi:hypothetical protein [Aurantiacibacter poecillastricola]|uniref:hypothetical protein n=1 Tax=Aurantiacibacter poecillastricola TaxID=3064385 RepID=UPI00273EFC82|nr:hypothetical protein [Aurantiacibacter sp. 219JJ12-13]MDP5261971.1 hypothetical protein [Aurantiacibacter sp. 219JJ12-13]
MRLYFFLISAAAVLASCDDGPSDAERAEVDRAVIEQVREANDAAPPLVEVVPDPLLYPDIEANDLFGVTCAYAPGTSLGARVIAREADAFMKVDGTVIRFAADPGSRELPAGTRSLYNGREYSLRLEIEDEGEGEPTADGGAKYYEGTIRLRDRWDRVIYQGTGAVNCGA